MAVITYYHINLYQRFVIYWTMKNPTQKLIKNIMVNMVQIIERYITHIKVVGYWLLLDIKLVHTLELSIIILLIYIKGL